MYKGNNLLVMHRILVRNCKPAILTILFSIPLKAGPNNLKTWFYTPEGEDWGAYYVYVTKTK